jgi:surface carbohydrate biosynthesis protein
MGYRTRIIPHGSQTTPLFDIRNFKPQFIIFPQVQGEEKLVKYAKEIGAHILVLHTEGTWNKEGASSFYARGKKLYKGENPVELDLVWGEVMKQLLTENTDLEDEEVRVVGCPRFDVYQPPLSELMMSKEEFCAKFDIKRNSPIVVWATNFVNVDRSEKSIQYLEEFTDRNIRELIDIQRTLRKRHFDVFAKLTEDFLQCEFIIKLHPLEIPKYYTNRIREMKLQNRIRVIAGIQMEHVLNSTDVFLNTNSTSSTEAWFLNIPTISLVFDRRALSNLSAFAGGNEIVSDYNSLKMIIEQCLKGKREPSDSMLNHREEFIEKWYYQVDGRATLRAAEEIDAHIKSTKIAEVAAGFTNEMIVEKLKASQLFRFIRSIYYMVRKGTNYWGTIASIDRLKEEEVMKLKEDIDRLYRKADILPAPSTD